ncbi:MAG: LysR family transcriptional regulator [Leptothrix sp. (in: Bacteria)]|nr:LysR family transcriptional regulator [Leptothrix sp. (in: b-proteobacteria)]
MVTTSSPAGNRTGVSRPGWTCRRWQVCPRRGGPALERFPEESTTITVTVTRKNDRSTDPGSPARLRLNLRQLEVFVATARAGSTRAAASQMARSQSAAHATLADLERILGAQLFDRVGRRLLLNEKGQTLLSEAAALLDRAAGVQAMFTHEHDAPLRVAASLTVGEYLLPELLGRWKQAHPGSPVRLMIGNTSEVIRAVVAFEADVGFIEGPQTHPQLVVHPWLVDELLVVAAPTHPLAGRPAAARQLRDAVWAVREPGSGTREAADRWLVDPLGPLNVGFELGSAEAIKRLVATGAALACVPRETVAWELEQGTLVEITTQLTRPRRRLSMVLHRDKHLGRGMDAFVRHCSEAAAQRQGK